MSSEPSQSGPSGASLIVEFSMHVHYDEFIGSATEQDSKGGGFVDRNRRGNEKGRKTVSGDGIVPTAVDAGARVLAPLLSSRFAAVPGEPLFGYTDAAVVRSAQSDARVVPDRILRRIARERMGAIDEGRLILHDDLAVVPDDLLVGLIDDDELDISGGESRPAVWILLSVEGKRATAEWDEARKRRELWRRLFHGIVDQWLLKRRTSGQWRRSLVRSWIDSLGETTLKEIRSVLREDRLIGADTSDPQMLAEFATVYLDLKWFEPEALPLVFPGLEQLKAQSLKWIDVEVPAAKLYEASRLPGASSLSPWSGAEWITEMWQPSQGDCISDHAHESHAATLQPPPAVTGEVPEVEPREDSDEPAESRIGRLVGDFRARLTGDDDRRTRMQATARHIGRKAAAYGNFVRAARWSVVERDAAPEHQGSAPDPIPLIESLADRLVDALRMPDQAEEWRLVLVRLFEADSGGFWSKDARALYDLQKVVVDAERPVYVVDWGRYLRSFGRVPVRRALPNVPYVMMLRHLRTALRRLPSLSVEESSKRVLRRLLEEAIHITEHRFRAHVRPVLEATLEEAGFVPGNLPERVSVKSVVDQLIDHVVEHGYFGLGHLRDAISRNDIKMKDLAGLREWARGDDLLQADALLAVRLDGIYRRGEIYLRALQRASAAVFAVPIGRLVTWYGILPFFGAFMLMGGLYFIPEELNHWVLERFDLKIYVPHQLNPLTHRGNVLLVGLFMLGMIHHKGFREWTLLTLRRSVLYLRGVIWDWPRRVLAVPIFKLVFGSRYVALLWKWVLKPLVFTSAIWWSIPDKSTERGGDVIAAVVAIYLAMVVFVNSRPGRDLQEHVLEWVSWAWRRFGVAFLVSTYRFLADVFEKLSETVNRALYAVDEFIRFRRRRGRVTEGFSGILGLVWGVSLYAFRFVFNLLVEPQINPIKHFPVVTVSHKFLLPMIPVLSATILPFFADDKKQATAVATLIMSVIPGAIGFIVWELKENWKLYEANRRRSIGPVLIGHHGETLARLLTPGFHSGTVPKLLHRMRKSRHKGLRTGRMAKLVELSLGYQQVEHALRNFFEREWLRLVNGSAAFRDKPLRVGPMWVTNNSVSIDVLAETGRPVLSVRFDSEDSWILAEAVRHEAASALRPDQWQCLKVSLAGLFAQCGVDMTATQIERTGLMRPLARVLVEEEGLVVFPDPMYRPRERLIYDISQFGSIEPRTKPITDPLAILDGILPEWRATEDDDPWPVLQSQQVNLKRTPVTWAEWVAYWGKGGRPGRLPERARLEIFPD